MFVKRLPKFNHNNLTLTVFLKMIKVVKRLLGLGQNNPLEGTTIVVNSEKLERRVALL